MKINLEMLTFCPKKLRSLSQLICARLSYWRGVLLVYFLKLLSDYSIKCLDILYMNRP